jgi:hypothetical protein
MTKFQRYGLNVLLGLDYFASSLLLGDPRESISSRLGKAQRDGRPWACVLCRALDAISPNHCADSIDATVGDLKIAEYRRLRERQLERGE